MTAIRAFLINLDRSQGRLARVSKRLDALGIDWVRVPAVDGNGLGEPPWQGFDARAYEWNRGKSASRGEVGCYLSHMKALKTMLADDVEFGLVLEDDADLGSNLVEVLADLMARREAWDLVKLNGRHWGMPITIESLRCGPNLVAFMQRNTGAAAYVVDRLAAERLYDGLLPMNVPYDHAFDQAWRFGFRLRGVMPYPVSLTGHDSTISTAEFGTSRGRKKVWYKRGGVLLYRAKTETRRVAHYLFSDPVLWLWSGRKRRQ